MFDGVHLGHQALLSRTRELAEGLPTIAVTFDPHPTAVVRPERAPLRLTTLERRIELLHEHGADEVRVLNFSSDMAAWTPQEFIDRVLVDELHAARVVVGENFRFGAKAAGDSELLIEVGQRQGFQAQCFALVRADQYSSSQARAYVARGLMREAADILGRPHEVSGTVTRGDQRGRDLGFPTANVPVEDRYVVPPDGVYAGFLVCRGVRYQAAISVGTNPTFAGTQRRVESYVIDRGNDLELYDQPVRVELVQMLRSMVAYQWVEDLVDQMEHDVVATRTILAEPSAPGPADS